MNNWSLKLSLPHRYVLVLLMFVLTAWLAYLYLARPSLGIDDAHIFFVYAQNISQGEGAVYNPGGEHVEGYSSPLWLFISTLAFALLDQPLPGLLVISLLLLSLGITLLWRWLDASERVTLKGILFLIWIFTSPSFIIWTTLTLMDTALWSVILALGCYILLTRPKPIYISSLVALTVLMRPEGMLWGILFVVLWGLRSLDKGWLSALRQMIKPILAYGVTLGLLIASRLLYFGYPLPNTYYAKMSPDVAYNIEQGAVYLGYFLVTNPIVLLVTLALSASIVLVNIPWLLKLFKDPQQVFEEKRIQALCVAVIVLVGLFVPVWMGGDHFDLSRFYQPLWPLFILPMFFLPELINIPLSSTLYRAGMVGLVLIFCFGHWTNWFWGDTLGRMKIEFSLAQIGYEMGHILNEMFAEDKPSVGVIVAGGIALSYEGFVVDVLGLNNVAVAHTPGQRYGMKNHSAFNSDVFLSQRPDLFLPEVASPSDTLDVLCHPFADWVVGEVFELSSFWQMYQRVVLVRGDNRVAVFANKAFLSQLPRQDFVIEPLDCSST